MTPRDEREPKLPNWAQDIINGLRRELTDKETRIRELQRDVPGTDTYLMRGWNDQEALPKGATVRFLTGGNSRDYIEVRTLRERDGEPGIQIMGGDMIAVTPQSGNVVRVRTL